MMPQRNNTEPLEDAAALAAKEKAAIFQTGVLMAAAFFIGVVVLILLGTGYEQDRRVPGAFKWPIIAVLAIGLLSAFPDNIARWWDQIAGDGGAYEPGAPIRKWKEHRPRVQPFVVFGLSMCLLAAFVALVWETGLAIESPYIPLVSAPAVFGPFVAKRRESVLALVVIVSFALLAITLWAPDSSCPGQRCSEAEERALGVQDAQLFKPNDGVYVGVAVTLVFLAGLISAGRLKRENRLGDENEQLTRALEHLREQSAQRVPDRPKTNGQSSDGERSDKLSPSPPTPLDERDDPQVGPSA